MKRTPLNLLVDLLAALGLLCMILTGYILRFPLPPTTNRTRELWGLSRHEWGMIHSWASLVLLAVIFVHLMLHWEWIFTNIRRRFTSAQASPKQRFHAGLAALATLLILISLFAWSTHAGVRELETPRHPLRSPPEGTADISAGIVPPQVIEFWRDVMPIFEASCIGCHGPKKQRADFRVDQREDFFAPGDAAPLIVPGDAKKSRIIAIVSGEVKEMKAAEDHVLPPHEIALLKAWINAGANWPEKAPTNSSTNKP